MRAERDSRADRRLRIAVLLSTLRFEDFYGAGLGLTRPHYLRSYRNDWSWDWCEMLAGESVDAVIYIATSGEAERVTTADRHGVRFLPLSAVAAPWQRYPVLGRTPVGRYLHQAANAAAFLRPLHRALVADRIDVLCVQEYWTARFDMIARSVELPVVAIDQGLPDRREIKFFKRGSFARAAAVVVQTDHERRKLVRFGADAQRIPNAVDTALFSPRPEAARAGAPTVLCVGRLHDSQKRISDVIRALALLPDDWRLEIAGTGPDSARLERLAGELGVGDRVSWLGFVGDSQDLRDLYRRASVLALPSAYEGLPMVLLEAMSCGTPVVGSDIAAIAEVVEHGRTGMLTPVGDPDRLADALRLAVAAGGELGPAARAAILSSYDQAVVAPRLAQILRAAVSSPVPRTGAGES